MAAFGFSLSCRKSTSLSDEKHQLKTFALEVKKIDFTQLREIIRRVAEQERKIAERAYNECHGHKEADGANYVGFDCTRFGPDMAIAISKESADSICKFIANHLVCYELYFQIFIKELCDKDAEILSKYNIQKGNCQHVVAEKIVSSYGPELNTAHIRVDPDELMKHHF